MTALWFRQRCRAIVRKWNFKAKLARMRESLTLAVLVDTRKKDCNLIGIWQFPYQTVGTLGVML